MRRSPHPPGPMGPHMHTPHDILPLQHRCGPPPNLTVEGPVLRIQTDGRATSRTDKGSRLAGAMLKNAVPGLIGIDTAICALHALTAARAAGGIVLEIEGAADGKSGRPGGSGAGDGGGEAVDEGGIA